MLFNKIKFGILTLGLLTLVGWVFPAQADYFPLPRVGVQNEVWTCGPNAATRVLQYFGSEAPLADVIATCPKSIEFAGFVVGPAPHTLALHMNYFQQLFPLKNAEQFEARTNLELEDVVSEISNLRPVILLIKQAEEEHSFFGMTIQAPALHYIAVHGWTDGEEGIEFTYTDSDDLEKKISYADLLAKWDWTANSPMVRPFLEKAQVAGKTMIVVKQKPLANAANLVLDVD